MQSGSFEKFHSSLNEASDCTKNGIRPGSGQNTTEQIHLKLNVNCCKFITYSSEVSINVLVTFPKVKEENKLLNTLIAIKTSTPMFYY